MFRKLDPDSVFRLKWSKVDRKPTCLVPWFGLPHTWSNFQNVLVIIFYNLDNGK